MNPSDDGRNRGKRIHSNMSITSNVIQEKIEVIEVYDSSADPTVDSEYSMMTAYTYVSDGNNDAYIDISDNDDDDDEYDAGSEEITLLPTRRSQSLSPSKSSISGLSRSSHSAASSRGRTPYERLMEYILDILEADDELPEQGCLDGTAIPPTSRPFFHCLGSGKIVLRPDVLLKINALLRQYSMHILVPQRSSNKTASSSNPSSSTSDYESRVEPEVMSKLLKILHRSIADQEIIDPFASNKKRMRSTKISKDHNRKRIRPESATLTKNAHSLADSAGDDDDEEENQDVITCVADKLGQIVYYGTAAHCAFTVFSSNIIDDSLRCEEVMLPYMHTIRLIVQRCFLPFLQACVGTASSSNSSTLNELVQALGVSGLSQKKGKVMKKDNSTITRMDGTQKCRTNLVRSMENLQSILCQLQALSSITSTWKISESCLAIIASSILPIFSVYEPDANPALESLKVGKAAWTSLRKGNEKSLLSSIRVPAFNALYGMFLHSESEHHAFIVNCIMDHIASIPESNKNSHRQYGLENGKAIHSISALLIRLVQSFTKPIQKIEQSFDRIMDMSQESVTKGEDKALEAAVKVHDTDSMRKQLDGPRNLSRLIAEGLLQRIKQKRAGKTNVGIDISSSTILEWLLNDLLETIFMLKWPGASLILSQICRLFIACYEDRQSSPELRGIVVDFLGQVAAHIQSSQARLRDFDSTADSQRNLFGKLNLSIDSQDHQPLLVLEEAYRKLIWNIQQQSDSKYCRLDGSAQFLESQWAVELAYLHRKVTERSEVAHASFNDDVGEKEGFFKMTSALDDALDRCTTISSDATTIRQGKQKLDHSEAESVRELFESVVHTFNYMIPCESMVDILLDASRGPVASNRGKALRALANISHADKYFLQSVEVRSAIQRCLVDESVNVRDTAVGLLGRFVLDNPSYIEPVLPSLMAKIEDAGLLVRKRVLRLLGDIFHKTENMNIKSACAVEIVRCVQDEEESMQELATSTVNGLWFTSIDNPETVKRKKETESEVHVNAAEENVITEMKITLASLCTVADGATTRTSPLEIVIRRLLDDDSLRRQARIQLNRIVDSLCTMIGKTVEQPSEQEMARYGRTLNLLVRLCPDSMTVSHSKVLLPCIRPCSTVAELSLLASLLSVYAASLPKLPKLALSFAQQLQDALRPLISQPSPHLPILSELMQCYGAVINHHTHDYAILIKTLQQCHRLLCGLVSKARSRKVFAVADRNDAVIIRLTALLVESVDFDRVRNVETNMAPNIDIITRRPIKDEIVTLFMRLFVNETFVPHALYGIRFMARGFPDLLTRDNVREQLSRILVNGLVNEKSIVLRALADILIVDESQHATKTVVQANFSNLVGNTESSANPISFEIVQTYLDVIVPLIHEPELQGSILDIIQHIIMRGMCHPMQCLPCLVAMETQIDVPGISLKAQQLHKNLVKKTGSNISFRYAQCAKTAWEMHVRQRNGDSILVRGAISHRSIFQPWYDVILDQQPKQARLDILTGFMKSFDVQTSTGECSQSDVQRARFMAEAISVLDFKMMDEVQYIIDHLQEILNVSGEQVRVFAMEEIEVDGEEEREEDELEEIELNRIIAFGQMSIILSFAYLLRFHLIEQYGISESRSQNTSTTSKASNKIANRKLAASTISWHDLPRATQIMNLSYKMAKQELINFDNLFSD